jgi:hypothetical protein
LIDLFGNSCLTLTLFESLPKDKTASLGVAEISLFSKFFKPKESQKLFYKETIPIVYGNTKLLQPSNESNVPEFEVEISLSRPFLTEQELAEGCFASFLIQDVYPVPEEWTLKEANEKDLNSSKFSLLFCMKHLFLFFNPSIDLFTYNVDFCVPGEGQVQRKISVHNGILSLGEVIHTNDFSKTISEGETQLAHSKSNDVVAEAKKVNWSYTHHVFLSGITLKKLREKAQKKEYLDLEVRIFTCSFSKFTFSHICMLVFTKFTS